MIALNNDKQSGQIIQKAWKEEKCPIINGIIFGNGKVVLLDVEDFHSIIRKRMQKKSIKVISHSDLNELEDTNRLEWSYITELFEINDSSRGIRISCGEGGMGADGFVAVTQEGTDVLEWIAFFDISNPFMEIHIHDNEIIATTNLGDKWHFLMNKPESVYIELGDGTGIKK